MHFFMGWSFAVSRVVVDCVDYVLLEVKLNWGIQSDV